VSGRDDGRLISTGRFVHALLKDNRPELAFQPETAAGEVGAWEDAVRGKLRELMRFPDVADQPEPKVLWTEQRDGYELQKWEAYPEARSVVPFLVLVPRATTPGPAVLCFPGSGYTKESLAGEPELHGGPETGVPPHDRMAQWYVKAGLVAIAVDNPGIGETSEAALGPDEFSQYLMWAGRSYEALSVFQKLPILAWARRQPFVDAKRVAVSGHSLGAKAALIVGLLDRDIAAVLWNDGVMSWRERAVAMNLRAPFVNRQFVPGMIEWFDYPDLMAALAPRPLLIAEGGRTRDIERLREAYRAAGAEDALGISYYPKYATPEQRLLDDVDLPEGLTDEEYQRYANIDPPGHWFKEDVAVPWLTRVLGLK
jgi:dienelactone hydrolase